MGKNDLTWNNVMSLAMQMPGVAVDRQSFLTTTFLPILDEDNLKNMLSGHRPLEYVSLEQLDAIAQAIIKDHLLKVTALSAATGIPGGPWVIATLPADMAQYYYHVFVLSQKMAYLYGYPDFRSTDGKLTPEAQYVLTLFVGVMSGVAAANEAIQQLSLVLSKNILERLPRYALTKTAIYPIIKQIAKWIGVKLTKESFSKGVSKVVPFVGAAISGSLTFVTFRKGSHKLQKTLHDNAPSIVSHTNNEEAEYEEIKQ